MMDNKGGKTGMIKKMWDRVDDKFNIRKLKSLRTVIIIAAIIAGVLPAVAAGKIITYSYRTKAMNDMIIEVQGQGSLLAADISKYGYFGDISSDVVNTELEQVTYTYSSRVLVIDSKCLIVKDTYAYEDGKTLVMPEVFSALRGNINKEYSNREGNARIFIPVYSADQSDEVIGVVGIIVTDNRIHENIGYLNRIAGAITVTFGLIFLGGGIFLANALVKPVYKLDASIQKVAAGDKNAHVESRTLYEYDRVAQSVNLMLDRIRFIDDSREEFVSNVSHELKTPMASMKVLAESLLTQEHAPEELYREFMADIVTEVDRENQIIGDLLELVRMDSTKSALNIATCNINELVERVLKTLKPIASQKNVELLLETFRPVAAEIDEVKLSLAITNLVENAIKYNVNGGWVRVSINADHKYFYINVQDSGIGIPAESCEHVFERFYRVDKARSRQTGGTGLGLAITKSVIMMHNGTIKLYSKENEGSTFTIRIPLYYVKAGGES